MIYLDYNATTPVDPAVAEAMMPFMQEEFGNPNSGHSFGKRSRTAIETAREQVAAMVGGLPEEIIFTSGGTEASNMAIKGAALLRESAGRHFVTTNVEHPATLGPMKWLGRWGYTHTEVGADMSGWVDPEAIRAAIRPDTVLISVMHAQNEVGTLEPIVEIGRIARAKGILFHVDTAQSLGKVAVNADEMNADFLSIAGHKFYGPKGIGALYVRKGIRIEPLIHGAAQESGRRGGTENLMMAVGLGKAAELSIEYFKKPGHHRLRDHFWSRLKATFGERVMLNGHATECVPSTVSVSFPGHVGGEILGKLDNVYASTGAACHAGDAKPSRVLTAMGYSVERAVGTIRFSVGRPTSEQEIDRVIDMLKKAI
ncbi:MAG: cysteine desulfurase [Planctomycetes bacterium]|nr:cysteine desulfurase [Planctomycetota bacterium]